MAPGELLRQARLRHGLTQKQLAIRAGTTQSAISRIERGHVSPTVDTLSELLRLMNEELVLGVRPEDHGHDPALLRERLMLQPDDRLRTGVGFANRIRRLQETARAG